mmetsp:Transcript_143687/g.400478  ORF Transcript_143687/g.400478 Transcript_143687/m.400478 type:complete len:214 (-) Transcript_143687:436-1077(-)
MRRPAGLHGRRLRGAARLQSRQCMGEDPPAALQPGQRAQQSRRCEGLPPGRRGPDDSGHRGRTGGDYGPAGEDPRNAGATGAANPGGARGRACRLRSDGAHGAAALGIATSAASQGSRNGPELCAEHVASAGGGQAPRSLRRAAAPKPGSEARGIGGVGHMPTDNRGMGLPGLRCSGHGPRHERGEVGVRNDASGAEPSRPRGDRSVLRLTHV